MNRGPRARAAARSVAKVELWNMMGPFEHLIMLWDSANTPKVSSDQKYVAENPDIVSTLALMRVRQRSRLKTSCSVQDMTAAGLG